MSKYNIDKIINTFSELGNLLSHPDTELSNIINNQMHYNAWFTPDSVEKAVISIGKMLNRTDLTTWLNHYQLNEGEPKKVGLILAGNIPLVGFHDILCVLASGNYALIKLSSQDNRLIKYVLQKSTDLNS
ncbi:MAG: acyl-CoA reductase, partial [Mucilaginibacter sp.]